jgi:hypothetical protein
VSDSFGSSSSDAASSILGGFIACYLLFLLVVVVVTIFILYKICQKTGNSGWLALLSLIPFGALGLMLFLAFSDWPVLRENRDLKARVGYIPPSYPPSDGYGAPTAQYYAPPAAPTSPFGTPEPYPGPPMAPQAPTYEQPTTPTPQAPSAEPPAQL